MEQNVISQLSAAPSSRRGSRRKSISMLDEPDKSLLKTASSSSRRGSRRKSVVPDDDDEDLNQPALLASLSHNRYQSSKSYKNFCSPQEMRS